MMRSWFASTFTTLSKDDTSQASEAKTDDTTGTFRPFPTGDSTRSVGSAFSFSRGSQRNFQDDARMERQVTLAAKYLGEGVQEIVIAAKTKQGGSEWKSDLLNLLGNNPPTEDSKKSDVDNLIENSKCEKFILRCVEAELPPNLIHCLRLIRVVELQQATTPEGEPKSPDDIQPIARKATQKVTRLLCLLCKDPSVGEQLRPHLFGLLALSGASYPPTGVHVAEAASQVIVALGEHCLTRQLVWFIHDRKMILHMTDDIKELTGLTQSASSPVPQCLTGEAAEKAGLWFIAFETVVKLVAFSCKFHTIDLLKDFEAAGGYEVLRYAIDNSTRPNGGKLVELLPYLICCPAVITDDFNEADLKLAVNVRPTRIQEELLHKSSPILIEFMSQNNGKVPNPSTDGTLRRLANMSILKASKIRAEEIAPEDNVFSFDVGSALLQASLQTFSDHPDNYSIIEGRQHILSFYLLSFPCYHSDDIKNSVLKILEFVLTGVGVSEEVTPVNTCVEIFFGLCQVLLSQGRTLEVEKGTLSKVLEALFADTLLMGKSLEKLLQFDRKVAGLMIESGMMTTNLNSLLELISEYQQSNVENAGQPPTQTVLDATFVIVCDVLKLLVADQHVNFSGAVTENEEPTSVHKMLRMTVHVLGDEACRAATGVFESYMSSSDSMEAMEVDMTFVLRMIESLAKSDSSLSLVVMGREAMLFSLLRSVLEARSLARDAFRTCGGFDAILTVVLALDGIFASGQSDEINDAALKLMETTIAIIDASIGSKSKSALNVSEVAPLIIPENVVVDSASSQLSSDAAAPNNRNHVRRNAYYLDFAAALVGTGFAGRRVEPKIVDLCLNHVDQVMKPLEKTDDVGSLRNPDGVRLLLGIAVFLPFEGEGSGLASKILDRVLQLSDGKTSVAAQAQLASCGLSMTLTSSKEFGPLLFNQKHPLSQKLVTLLCRLASFGTSYMDFIGILRRAGGPLLAKSGPDGKLIKLQVISSAVGKRPAIQESKSEESDTGFLDDEEILPRLRVIRDIARYPNGYRRLILGGDSINTIGVLMHQVKLEDRLKAAAEEGRLRFVEIECVDSSAVTSEGPVQPDPYRNAEEIWHPLAGAGFSYSCWLRHTVAPGSGVSGNIYIIDISSPVLSEVSSKQNSAFLALWFDLQGQRFNVMSSASHRGEPICFPVSPLVPNVWHHILVTYTPGKRSMMSRKSVFSIYVDGRPLEAEVKVETVNLPPNARVILGAPNPALAASGIVRGKLPVWEMGPTMLLSTVLLELDATALYSYGPDFPGLLWGDRPERQSLTATGTCLFSSLAEAGELGSVASALRRRNISMMEGTGSNMNFQNQNMGLSAFNLYCSIPPECVIFSLQAGTVRWKIKNDMSRKDRRLASERLVNLARLGFSSSSVSTDAVVYGKNSIIAPSSFADSLQWAGGPDILMPMVSAANSPAALALALQIMREACRRHPPNVEAMQSGGGFRTLAVLLQEKSFLDEACLDQCMAFAIHGFEPMSEDSMNDENRSMSHVQWVLSDLEAMRHLVLNHQVWDLKRHGPNLPIRLLTLLNRLVDHKSIHKAFNARRLHMVGIVRWGLHLMLEASELYTAGDSSVRNAETFSDMDLQKSNLDAWICEAPLVSDVSVGGDPGNPFLQACKNLLRRVLTFMLTPGDLEAVSEALVYTVTMVSPSGNTGGALGKRANMVRAMNEREGERKMLPSSTTRLYLVRLLEELIVDGVNEIVAAAANAHEAKGSGVPVVEQTVQPHAGGVASPNQPYLATPALRAKVSEGLFHPKHHQAQAFLSAFAGYLSPIWFATLLEGCREEASASATVRLMVLMLQASTSFESAFQEAGEFGPFVTSIPRFSTCASVTISLLSQHFGVPILHIHSLSSLDPQNLSEVFDAEFDDSDQCVFPTTLDPANGIFALIAECVGRNLQLMSTENELSLKAAEVNKAILHLISHRHSISESFRRYCSAPVFIEPFTQSLCLLHVQTEVPRTRRPSKLSDVPKDLTPTERFIGGPVDENEKASGLIRLLRQLIKHAFTMREAAKIISAIFGSIPVHATSSEVKALHLLLIEHCGAIMDNLVVGNDILVLSNCVGACSVLLDQLVRGFGSTEIILRTVKISIYVLEALTDPKLEAFGGTSTAEHSLITGDAAHYCRLICAVSLRWSIDRADDDLQTAILEIIDTRIELLLLVPSRERIIPSGPVQRVLGSSALFHIWLSDSLVRCIPSKPSSYPDSSDGTEAELAAFAPLIVSLHSLLTAHNENIRSLAISVFVALLKHRENAMSELLVDNIQRGEVVETVDVVSRGGFRALLAAHEAAEMNRDSKVQSVKRRYAPFFDWYDKNQETVQLLFEKIDEKANTLFSGLKTSSMMQEEAVESEQKLIVTRLTEQGSADLTILGGLRRADLSRRCAEKTSETHARWKRQGFDDLAFGAMKWKILLRQMKGSFSIWEGGQATKRHDEIILPSHLQFMRQRLLKEKKLQEDRVLDLVLHWKLDLSEGYERQRRRLLPNYEFQRLYNVDEDADFSAPASDGQFTENSEFLGAATQMEATAELLKDMNLKRAAKGDIDNEFEEGDLDETQTVATSATSVTERSAQETKQSGDGTGGDEPDAPDTNEDSSSYELINGLLQSGDYPERSYNVRRCTGLEVTKALLLWCSEAIYVVDGFEQSLGEDMEPKITRVEKEQAIFKVTLRGKGATSKEDKQSHNSGYASTGVKKAPSHRARTSNEPANDVIYQHKSKRISFEELYAVFRRRYQLQQNALEFFDINKNGTLIAFDGNKEREEVLSKLLMSRLPNSIFHSSYGSFISYSKFVSNLKNKIVSQWVAGKMTNFDFLMHLNSLAGRTFNDLTQYPVFPWVIADYDSEELDLNNPAVFRDLSKPMGALGDERADQFRERYESLASSVEGDEDPPPFHYGTHYSCAAYVLYYLMRLEPFSRLALSLQGGRFDVADRLFHDVGRSWKSASEENLQDVRELIPEFYYLPDFLSNTNSFDFGETQKGKTVDDVSLPKWAKGDPHRFVRMNRKALESPYVSANLHKWVDLIFGYKQRGEEAVEALNTFVHVTYEGEVDIDSMDDPIQRASTIAQIQNFGQTPRQLERRPFQPRQTAKAIKDNMIDFAAVTVLAPLTPPLCIAGAPQRAKVRPTLSDTLKVGLSEQLDTCVGDLCHTKGQLIAVARSCALIVGPRKYIRYGGLTNGISIHTAAISTRYREVDKVLSIHDGLHRAPICAAKASFDGSWIVTASIDSSIRVWHYGGDSLILKATLCGHDGSPVKSLDISTEFGVIVSGCARGRILVWDLRGLTFVRSLSNGSKGASTNYVGVNNKNGNIVALVGTTLQVFDINGREVGTREMSTSNPPTSACTTDCPEWMDYGVVAVTGHESGEIRLWGLDYDRHTLPLLSVISENPHTDPISCLAVTGADRQDTLLAGDAAGKLTVFKTVQLEDSSPDELNVIIEELS